MPNKHSSLQKCSLLATVPGEMRILSEQELEEAQGWAQSRLPHSSLIWLWIKINLDRPGGIGTSPTPKCYVDDWPNPKVMAGVDLVESYHLDNFPVLCMYADLESEEAERVEKLMIEVGEDIGVRQIGGIHPQAISDQWIPVFHRVFADRFGLNASIRTWPCKAYFVAEEEQDRIRNQVIEAPKGFEFKRLTLNDSQFVDAVWPHRVVGSLKLMQRRIRDFPSVALRENDGQNRLAAFELIHDQLGFMNHLYTAPEFRRRGLATLVELKLVQLMIEEGYFPVKTVLQGNTSGEKITDAVSYWKYYGDVSWLRYGDDRIVSAFTEIDRGDSPRC